MSRLISRRLVPQMVSASSFNHLDWSLTPKQIQDRTASLIEETRSKYNNLVSRTSAPQFKNTLAQIALWEGENATVNTSLTFPQHASTNSEVRTASAEAEKALDAFDIECDMRTDVYKVVKQAVQNTSVANLLPEEQRLVHKILLQYKRNGLDLADEPQQRLKAIKTRLSELSNQFSRTLAEDQTKIQFDKEALEGCPEDFLAGLEQATVEGKVMYTLTMKYPDVLGVLKLAKKEATRRTMDIAFNSRCRSNIALLEEAIVLRQEAAQLLGYKNHASLKLEDRMAKDPNRVLDFLQDLRQKLQPLAENELKQLVALKKADPLTEGSFNDRIYSWDFQYYHRQLLERDFQVDDEKVKEYFSLPTVTQGMLELYQRVLSLRFTEEKTPVTWHPDVRLFLVHDAETGDYMGQFYLDLHPRDGKYTHAACFGLQPGFSIDAEKRQFPVAAMVANFSKPTATHPSLLKHNEVVTYFHELGHVMHQLCAKSQFARFHGTSVERDFVEAPSQMLENWCWQVPVLTLLSSHYQRPQEKLDAALVERLVRAKNLNAGLLHLRQVFFALYDLKVHTLEHEKRVDVVQLWDEMREKVTLIPSAEGTCPAASFGHIMGGYDSGYYGYLWSQVFSADMFYTRFVNNVFDTVAGQAYRRDILLPGGSRDADESLVAFLGRPPQSEAFLHSIGLSA